MAKNKDQEQLQADRKTAQTAFTELLTAVPAESKDALKGLHDLVRAEIELARCNCKVAH